MRKLVPLVVVLLALSVSTVAAGAPVRTVTGGCGGTALHRGAMPAWTAPAMADSPGFSGPPFALSAHRKAVALVFGYPLWAGKPRPGRQDKVLWIMRLPRRGLPLQITAHPLHATRPVVRVSYPANSGPGEIYPTYVNVPTAGCWRLTLRWAGHSDQIALRYS